MLDRSRPPENAPQAALGGEDAPVPDERAVASSFPLKDTVTTDTPETPVPADNDAAATTEHLRRLWMAGARDITVTYDADAVRHRTYLSHPRPDNPAAGQSHGQTKEHNHE